MNTTPETPAERIRAWWTARPAPAIRPEDECFDLTLNRPILRVLDIPALLTERDALAKRVAELEDERDDAQSDYAVMGSDLIGVYRERAHLVALLAAQHPAQLRKDPEDEDGEWSIVYIDLPTGQASWHIHPRDMDLFSHVEFGTDTEWDGHSTEEKYRRIAEYTAQQAGAR